MSDEAIIGIVGAVVAAAALVWAVIAWWLPSPHAKKTKAGGAQANAFMGGDAMIDIAALAATTVGSFLVPYLKRGAQGIADAVGKRFSEAAADETATVAATLWKRVTEIFHSDEDKTVVELFEKDPDGLSRSLTERLEAKLRQDEGLAREIAQLVGSDRRDQAAPATIMQDAEVAAVVNMPQADFRSASNFKIVAVERGVGPTKPTGAPEQSPETSPSPE
jgi:hypothetical protein